MPVRRPIENGSVNVETDPTPANIEAALVSVLNDVDQVPSTLLLIAAGRWSGSALVSSLNCEIVSTATGVYEVQLTSRALNAGVSNIQAVASVTAEDGSLITDSSTVVLFYPAVITDPIIVRTKVGATATDMGFSIHVTGFDIPLG